jgi:hypothetical protein
VWFTAGQEKRAPKRIRKRGGALFYERGPVFFLFVPGGALLGSGEGERVSARVSPVQLAARPRAPRRTGDERRRPACITVAMASCPAAGGALLGEKKKGGKEEGGARDDSPAPSPAPPNPQFTPRSALAREGPACKGRHSLPHCPGTFARFGGLSSPLVRGGGKERGIHPPDGREKHTLPAWRPRHPRKKAAPLERELGARGRGGALRRASRP